MALAGEVILQVKEHSDYTGNHGDRSIHQTQIEQCFRVNVPGSAPTGNEITSIAIPANKWPRPEEALAKNDLAA